MLLTRQSINDFEQACARATWERWLNFIRRRPNDLLSFEAVEQVLGHHGSVQRDLRKIPIEQIVGSVGRYREFNRSFLPVSNRSGFRWRRVNELFHNQGFDPIAVYQFGGVYFVIDGNHRVSVNRVHKISTIEAYVTELWSPVPIYRDDRLADIIERHQKAGRTRRPRRISTSSYPVACGC